MEHKPTKEEFRAYINAHKSMSHIDQEALYEYFESIDWRRAGGKGEVAKTWQSLVNSYSPIIEKKYPHLTKKYVKYPFTERPWTNDDEDYLIAEFNKGIKIEDISSYLKREPTAIVCKLLALQLQGKYLNIPPKYVR